MGETVFITGATGFIGSYLTKRLVEAGFAIKALRRASSQIPQILRNPKIASYIEWVEGDVLDPESLFEHMQGCRTVCHGAAIVSFDPSDHQTMMRVNVQGTANMVNAAIAHKVGRFFHISSVAAIGRRPDNAPRNEDSTWENNKINSMYSRSKFYSENEVWRGMAEGLNTIIVNPSVVLGPWDRWHEGTAALFLKVWEGLRFYTDGAIGMVDVRDVAEAALRLMEHSDPDRIQNRRYIVSAETVGFKDFFTRVATVLGRRPPTIRANSMMTGLAWRMQWLRCKLGGNKPLITRESVRNASNRTHFGNERILKTLEDFVFRSIDETIQWTGKTLRKELG